MTLASMQTYIYKRTNTDSNSFVNADMLVLLNDAYNRVSTLARKWFDNYQPALWDATALTTGTAIPVLDANFHELIPLWVSYMYAATYIPQIAQGLLNEILVKEGTLEEFYSGRSYLVCTVTIASPGVFTCPDVNLHVDDIISFVTSGALPTGLSVDTKYYVLSPGLDDDNFRVSATRERDGGTAINTSGTQSGTHWLYVQRPKRMTPGSQTRGDSSK